MLEFYLGKALNKEPWTNQQKQETGGVWQSTSLESTSLESVWQSTSLASCSQIFWLLFEFRLYYFETQHHPLECKNLFSCIQK